MKRVIVVLSCLSTLSCGGMFLPPPAPGRACIYNLQHEIVPKGDCGCYDIAGQFTWKHYKLRACPTPQPPPSEER